GLLVKKYLNNYGGESVDKFIDIGTPHNGAPKSFKILTYGDDLGISIEIEEVGLYYSVLNPNRVKIISQNMPSVYQLLPSQKYLENTDLGYYIFDGDNNSQRLTFAETQNYLKTTGRNSLLIDRADEFHQEIDNLNPADYGVETYNIVGCGTPTLGRIYVWGEDKYSIHMIDGDGTVPLRSAEAVPALETYYANGVKHAVMPSSTGIKELIGAILTSDENFDLSLFSNLATNPDDCGIPDGKIVSFHSPIELHIYDPSNNHVGPNEDGDIENNIEGVVYEIIEDNKFAFLPNGVEYMIKGNATDSGTLDIHIQEMVGGEVATTTIFADIPLTLTTQTEFTISTSIPIQIALDNDNDGSFESSQPVFTTTLGLVESLPSPGAEISDSVSATQVSSSNPVVSRPIAEAVIESDVKTDAELQAAYADIYRRLVEISVILDEMAAQEQEELANTAEVAEEVILPENSSPQIQQESVSIEQADIVESTTDSEITQQNSVIKGGNLATGYQAVSQAVTNFLEKMFKTIWSWIINRL
ncbi:MAG: hypothetical protein Q8Q65_00070, partial [bacterium]|nr:hypothetical protein [bacterium]